MWPVVISLGGTLDETKHFNDWIRMRVSLEDIMGAAPIQINTLASSQRHFSTTVNPLAIAAAAGKSAMIPRKKRDTADKQSTTPKYRLAKSLSDEEHLLKTYKEIRQENMHLENENRRLEHLLAKARQMTPNVPSLYDNGNYDV